MARNIASIVTALVALLFLASACSANPDQSAPLDVVLSMPSEAPAGSSVDVKLTVTNNTDEPISYSPAGEEITPLGSGSDGGPEIRALLFREDFFYSFDLAAGESRTHSATWDLTADIPDDEPLDEPLEPGEYSISSEADLVPALDYEQPRIESKPVKLVVK